MNISRQTSSRQTLPIRKRYKLMKWLAPFISLLPLRLGTVLRMSGSDKELPSRHHYGPTYHRIFCRMKYRHLTLLEIGIGGYDEYAGGESLAAWRCYFPFGKIVGCDIEDKRILAGGRVRIHVLDQSSATDLARIALQEGPFDIIIDDGSHLNTHQIFSFKNLFAQVKEGGIYVIEDTQTSYWAEYGGKPVNQQTLSTAMGYFTELAKYLNYPEFRTEEGADAEMISLAKTIASIYFEHTLIILHKQISAIEVVPLPVICPRQTEPRANLAPDETCTPNSSKCLRAGSAVTLPRTFIQRRLESGGRRYPLGR